ncbi:polyketide synthase [Aspergillus campestris IBT 28561]|uniref:Polyketide synthase n=1 Tax=Aspergillus campestris (strain IBT 28561) TaxID=1392248 RepID=A0A2I1CT02_ASPC2|nr:polyketide synthase [Aspergillus campestris IBT 28561]PKY00760.1 polyketide synthase [Aspergillus campestris IBT 28561]
MGTVVSVSSNPLKDHDTPTTPLEAMAQPTPCADSVCMQASNNATLNEPPVISSQDRASVNGDDIAKPAAQVPVAICGMSVRLPGGLRSPQELWDFILSKSDARGPVPKSRYNVSAHYSDRRKPGTVATEYGYFLDESTDISALDTSFFHMGKSEVERADPHQRLMLEAARECLEDAGETNWKGRPIGCYIGSFADDWVEMFAKETQPYGSYRATGHGDFMLPNRVSYEMDLTGPSILLRTGCSASMVALHEACVAVSRGDCESAIVGGVNLILHPGMTAAVSEQGALSPDGSCKIFSADANGYARADAISAIFIKPLSDAIRDGNPIRAVIRGTGTNSDGRGTAAGIQVPNGVTHEALMRRTYQMAGITNFAETAFVECHGTGTSIGDPIEAGAVGRVFGPTGGVQIGSVKANVGHSEGASGLTSIVKAVMALEHRVIPPNIKFHEPNPKIPWDSCGLSVPTESMPWPEGRKERISVNSFGVGGANAHVVLDSALSCGVPPVARRPFTSPELLLYSANTKESLERMTVAYQAWVQENQDTVSDLAFTLANRREHLPYRAFAVASPGGSLTTSPPVRSQEPPAILMVFTGQGAQWPQMGHCLLNDPSYPVFKKRIQSLDAHLQTLRHAPKWSIETELEAPASSSRLGSAELAQPLCTAIQIALVDCLTSIGVQPTAVVGHSSGEIVAAYAAGAISPFAAITVAFYRGFVTRHIKNGAMAAIGLGSKDVQEYLEPGVVVACENSPKSVTLAGNIRGVELVVARIQEAQPGILAKLLRVDKAYHTSHMVEIGGEYENLIRHEVSAKAPQRFVYSSVTGELLDPDCDLGATYWRKNLESPVRFYSVMSWIMQHEQSKNMVMVEVGPHSALAGPLRQIQAECSNNAPYVSALTRHQNDVETFLRLIGTLYSLNVPVQLEKVVSSGSCLPDLPRYPWDHSQSFWYESRLSKEWRHRKHAHHDLLGLRVAESSHFNVLFRNIFHLDNAPWIRDHKVREDIVFPLAGYVGMIGEAARQVTDIDKSFTLRKVLISAALVLNEGSPVEMVTTLQRQRLTDSLDSEWWEFTIASYNGTSWLKHCSGEVRAHEDDLGEAKRHDPLVRKVETPRFYRYLAKSGIHLGPAFQRLDAIRSDTVTTDATSKVAAKPEDGIGYHVHPAVVDASLQMLSAAVSKGQVNGTTKMLIPTEVKELSITRCTEDVGIQASASYTRDGSIIGGARGVTVDGRIVFRSSGVKRSVLDDQGPGNGGIATARATWSPHIDFLDPLTLIKPFIDRSSEMPVLVELERLCMLHTKRTLEGLDSPINHMRKYKSWINREWATVELQRLDHLDNTALEFRAVSIVRELSQTPAADAAMGIWKIGGNIESIFTGTVEPLEVLLADNTLVNIYDYLDQCDETRLLMEALTHSKPNLRVLEIGAGTGGSTVNILRLLTPGGNPLYSKYTFSDISSGFFVAAKERFKSFPNIEYLPLDISKDPLEQGFDGRKYDLILASNVLHATKSLRESLGNIHKLLDTNGRLLLHELNPSARWPNYIFGTLAGWWYGEADGRADEPYVDADRWTKELMSAGFCAPDAAVLDSPVPHQLNTTYLARPAVQDPPKKVTLLTLSDSDNVRSIVYSLANRGYAIDHRGLQGPFPADQDVIALLDADGPFFENIDEERFETFKALVGELKDCGIFWVTALSQVQCQDPRYGQITGIARVMRSEMLVDFATCEVDDVGLSVHRIVDVFEKFQTRQVRDNLRPEMEYAIVNNAVYVGRIHTFSVHDELLEPDMGKSVALRTSKPGNLANLHWMAHDIEEMEDGDVEVDIHTTGLNFRVIQGQDVLVAMGIVEASGGGIGQEAAGIVRRTGATVTTLQAGDRVMLLSNYMFSTRRVLPESLCEKIPDGLSFEDAATLPLVFATAIYSLFHLGNLKKGQSILIHSACGGVGLATIQLAQMAGAAIYATVGNEEKVKHLTDMLNLPRNRIFSSRSATFADDIMRETNNRGVDLALNSLSGELLHATWRCIAPFGKMIEIGKRDLIGSTKLDMVPFLDNRSYCSVDLDKISLQRPAIAKELLTEIGNFVRERHIHPIRPIKVFDSNRIVDAFRYMQQGVHLGKIVVSMRDATGQSTVAEDSVVKQRKDTTFDSSAAYLLVGGLGGLGRSVSTWMVERGARHLIFLSRSAGATNTHSEFCQEISSMGCRVDIVQGTVLRIEDVTRAIDHAHGRLKGILQMSMVLRDRGFPRMTKAEWDTAVDPKVQGTWNLHNAALAMDIGLEFFVLFSSINGIVGQPGQTNYAGANTFMDAFAQYRRQMGLPACAIQIGVVEDVGYVAENASVQQRFTQTVGSDGTISEQELLSAIGAATTSTKDFYVGVRSSMRLNNPGERSPWKGDIRMAAFHNGEEAGQTAQDSTSNDLQTFIAKARSDPALLEQADSAHFLAREIGKKVFSLLLKPEEELRTSCSLSELGLDSLFAIEVRQWWRTVFGFNINVLEMMGMGSLDDLGVHAARGLSALFHG